MMRESDIARFLAACELSHANRSILAGDASFRKYWRITNSDKHYVLMDAPPEKEDVRPFIQVTKLLLNAKLRVPNILHADPENGFLLLEDLGDDLFSKLLQQRPKEELALYHEACEALISLQHYSYNHPENASQLAPYNVETYLRETNLFAEWFLPQIIAADQLPTLTQTWQALWQDILARASLEKNCIVHRDYHADNLLWLPGEGLGRVGMLDYQDALLGDPLYDVVSLLEDARRDVNPQTVQTCKEQIFSALKADTDQLQQRYNILAAQRNCKIIGIFVRLAVRDKKPHYIDLLPRVWEHLQRDLTDPALAPVLEFIDSHVPMAYRGSFLIKQTSKIAGQA